MKKYLKRGDTWIAELNVTENDEAMDCTGYTAKMWIKAELKESSPELFELDINWTNQVGGIGYFSFTHAMSITLLGRYWYEIKLIEEVSNEIVQTLIQDRLIIRETLEMNL